MAPHGEAIVSSNVRNKDFNRPPKLCTDGLQRTISDTSFLLISRDLIDVAKHLPPINEVEDAKCECCGMREECTPEYINQVREKFYGKWICGLCSEAVKEESEKNGGKSDEALSTHMGHCVRFNKLGRAFPVLCQAEAMREILRKGTRARSTSMSPKDKGPKRGGGIARSSSCMPAITREMNDLALGN
ncbi:hypothetical protein Nepgr_019526 [Nepenthes gracilis]|uniref:Uncharacterized protein n=1 Tax=Nepenthes gracilis TaxID=150966 RepID=A0AAD3XVB9_NEPGR|nr:hypothetical protein Nepgr_019526 [Nepenthes gracilis]